jgi:hypothetical protein
MIPAHFNQHFASTTQFWTGCDSQERFEENCKIEKHYEKLKELGWLDGQALTYQYNSEGFRDSEFDQQPAGIALGCSHTEGVGIHAEHAWPRQLQNLLGQKIWNLGVGGAALDTCYRLLEYWIEHLNVEFVVCAVPGISRYEVFANNNWSTILPSEEFWPNMRWLTRYQQNYISYDQNGELNRRKNLQAMQYICDKHSVPFYYDLMEDFGDAALARDLLHSGPGAHEKLAKKFFNNIKGNNK